MCARAHGSGEAEDNIGTCFSVEEKHPRSVRTPPNPLKNHESSRTPNSENDRTPGGAHPHRGSFDRAKISPNPKPTNPASPHPNPIFNCVITKYLIVF